MTRLTERDDNFIFERKKNAIYGLFTLSLTKCNLNLPLFNCTIVYIGAISVIFRLHFHIVFICFPTENHQKLVFLAIVDLHNYGHDWNSLPSGILRWESKQFCRVLPVGRISPSFSCKRFIYGWVRMLKIRIKRVKE